LIKNLFASYPMPAAIRGVQEDACARRTFSN